MDEREKKPDHVRLHARILDGWRTGVPGGYREVWLLAYPVIIGMISHTLMGLVDAMMVGRLGTAPLAAVGFAGMLVWTMFSFFNGFLGSVNTFVAQAYGRKDYGEIGRMTWQGLYMVAGSYLLVLLLKPAIDRIFALTGSSDDVKFLGIQYATIIIYSGLPTFTNFCVSGFFRGIGDTKTPMRIAIAANITNVILNYLLIFGKFGFPRLEVKGAALATLISSVVSAFMYLFLFWSRKHAQRYGTRRERNPSFRDMIRILKVGLPMGVQWFLDMTSFTVFTVLIARMGDASLAANNAAIRLMSTSFMPLVGLSTAATTLVGQYIGAERLDLARKSGNTTIKMGVAYTVVVAWFFLIIPETMMRIITREPEVISHGAGVLRLAGIFQLFDGFGICSNGALRGAGDTRFTMTIGLLYAWFLFLPLAYLFGIVLRGGVVGAWIGGTIYICLLGMTFLSRFRGRKWEQIKI